MQSNFTVVAPNLYQYNKDQNVTLFIWRVSYEFSLRSLLKGEMLLGKGHFTVFQSCTRLISKSACLQLQRLMWVFVNDRICNSNKTHQNCIIIFAPWYQTSVFGSKLQWFPVRLFMKLLQKKLLLFLCPWIHTFSSLTSSAAHQPSSTDLSANLEVRWCIIALHSQLRTFKLFALCFDYAFILTWKRII